MILYGYMRPLTIDDVDIGYARSGGKGGQNVNKVETKADVRISVERLPIHPEQKIIIRRKLKNRINLEGELYVVAQTTRYREQNVRIALEKLNTLIQEALIVATIRKATKTPRSVVRRRVADKRRVSQTKQSRRGSGDE